MKRSAPLRRTPFKRTTSFPARAENKAPCPAPLLSARPADAPRAVMVSAALAARPKREYVRSEAPMRAYRLIPCQHCGRDDGTVCGAHPNWSDSGKGMSIKGCDAQAASLCFTCHAALDQGSRLTYDERRAMHEAARLKTLAELLRLGLWPPGVPLPASRHHS